MVGQEPLKLFVPGSTPGSSTKFKNQTKTKLDKKLYVRNSV